MQLVSREKAATSAASASQRPSRAFNGRVCQWRHRAGWDGHRQTAPTFHQYCQRRRQLAGSIAAQSTALAQIFGAGATPDPMPAIGNILMLAGVTLAVASGLHVKAAVAMARSYEILPMGLPVPAADIAAWGTARVAQAFALGFSMAAPFVIAAFAYNLALGAINRAMPQLMVAFVGAPAITAGGLLILMLAAPTILTFWSGRLDLVLADPLALPR
jgi:flagellar biosynthetic protein FliR